MITYKGFNGDMTCRGFAFREGERSEESEAQAGRVRLSLGGESA